MGHHLPSNLFPVPICIQGSTPVSVAGMLHLHGKSSEQTIVDISACYAPLQNAFFQPPSYHIIDHRTVPLTLFLVNQCPEEKCIHYLSQNIKPEYVVEGLKQSDFVHLSPLLLLIFLCDQEGQRIDSCID